MGVILALFLILEENPVIVSKALVSNSLMQELDSCIVPIYKTKGMEHLKYHNIQENGFNISRTSGRVTAFMQPSFFPYYIESVLVWIHITDTSYSMLDTIWIWSDNGGPDNLIEELVWRVSFPGFRHDIPETTWVYGFEFPRPSVGCSTPKFWVGYSSSIYGNDSTQFVSDIFSNISTSQHNWGAGWLTSSNNWGIEAVVADPPMNIEDSAKFVSPFNIELNIFPNPVKFGEIQKVSYITPENTYVLLSVYDICGKLIEKLVDSKKETSMVNGRRVSNRGEVQEISRVVPYKKPGIYFYRLSAGSFTVVKKFVVLPAGRVR